MKNLLRIARPVIKWLGGKTQLLPELRRRLPKDIGTYVEPFVGGGVLFYNAQPSCAIINDSNAKLVNTYISTRDHKEQLMNHLSAYEQEYNGLTSHDAQKDFYYKTRADFNASDSNLAVEDAARFIFINKTCFNGLYRENAAGEFNASFGWRKTISLYDENNLNSCSIALQNVVIMNCDFENACANLTSGDFVYFDSPYYSTFDAYQKNCFSEDDHVRLYKLFIRLTEAGVRCMLSNSNTNFIKTLYGDYNIDVVSVRRMINCDVNGCQGEEIIVTNYNQTEE